MMVNKQFFILMTLAKKKKTKTFCRQVLSSLIKCKCSLMPYKFMKAWNAPIFSLAQQKETLWWLTIYF